MWEPCLLMKLSPFSIWRRQRLLGSTARSKQMIETSSRPYGSEHPSWGRQSMQMCRNLFSQTKTRTAAFGSLQGVVAIFRIAGLYDQP